MALWTVKENEAEKNDHTQTPISEVEETEATVWHFKNFQQHYNIMVK